jgi:hypothetical protein
MKLTNILLVLTLAIFNAKSWSQEVPAGDTTPSAGTDTTSGSAAETTPAPEAPTPSSGAEASKAPEASKPAAKTPDTKAPAAKTPAAKTPDSKTPAAKAPEAEKTPAKPEVSNEPGSSDDEGSVDEGNADSGSSGEGTIDEGSSDEGNSDVGNTDEGNSDEGSAEEGGSSGSGKHPESGKNPESSKTPKSPETNKTPTPREQAEESAAREIGRVIGNKIGQDAVSKMNKVDRKALLERTRTALRGEILRKYAFSESPFMNSFVGTMMVLREGKDYAGFKCKELEIDLVYKVQRIYSKAVLCQESSGEWAEVDARNVTFPRRGEPTPGRSSGSGPNKPGKGGWLPPL